MTLSRLITWMTGISGVAIRALPPAERARLAEQCFRLLRECDVAPPRQPKSGVLSDLQDGRGRQ
jgi:hypothetical protein